MKARADRGTLERPWGRGSHSSIVGGVVMKLMIGVVLAVVLVAGCEQRYWYQEGKTFDECQAARNACRAELDKRSDLHYVSKYELEFIKTCMEQRGYRLVRASDLPLDIKRQEPDAESAVPIDRSWGIAGRLAP
jgi:hypothetical protein